MGERPTEDEEHLAEATGDRREGGHLKRQRENGPTKKKTNDGGESAPHTSTDTHIHAMHTGARMHENTLSRGTHVRVRHTARTMRERKREGEREAHVHTTTQGKKSRRLTTSSKTAKRRKQRRERVHK